MLSLEKQAVYISGTQTGTGSEQSLAHGFAAVPDLVLVQVDDEATATATLGTHTSSVVKVTVTNAKTYKLLAYFFHK